MIQLGPLSKAILVALSIVVARNAAAEPPNATVTVTAPADPRPARTLANFGLSMGETTPPDTGLSGLWSSLSKLAAARACLNRCPPTSWTAPDPSLGALGKISGAGLAIGAGGVGLAIGRIALRGNRSTGSTLRNILRSLSIRPVPGGAGLAFTF